MSWQHWMHCFYLDKEQVHSIINVTHFLQSLFQHKINLNRVPLKKENWSLSVSILDFFVCSPWQDRWWFWRYRPISCFFRKSEILMELDRQKCLFLKFDLRDKVGLRNLLFKQCCFIVLWLLKSLYQRFLLEVRTK